MTPITTTSPALSPVDLQTPFAFLAGESDPMTRFVAFAIALGGTALALAMVGQVIALSF